MRWFVGSVVLFGLSLYKMPGTHGEGCGCRDEKELGGADFLLPFIDKDAMRALNEEEEGSAKLIFKSYEQRLDERSHCKSVMGDPEMIIQVPFTSPCKVSGLHVIGGDLGTSPEKVRIFSNQETLDFTNVDDFEPVQEIELVEDYHGSLEYPLKVTKLQNVNSITLYFHGNLGGDFLDLYYIGLRGQGSNFQRKAVVTVRLCCEATARLPYFLTSMICCIELLSIPSRFMRQVPTSLITKSEEIRTCLSWGYEGG